MKLSTTLNRFPTNHPGYETIKDDPEFQPERHLALTTPESITTLEELGYDETVRSLTPSPVGITSPFRILSTEGVAAMLHVCHQLEEFITSNERVARNCRGGVYRSRFLRDFSLSVDVTEHLASVMQTGLSPHAMAHQLSHINYAPLTVGKNVDKWHVDTLQTDYVLTVTNPKELDGGEFQFFNGTLDDVEALKAEGRPLPHEKVIAPELPQAGYAVLMQGNYVVHQAKGLNTQGERITLVNAYNFDDLSKPDYTALGQLKHADPAAITVAEYTRLMSLRCANHLESVINTPDFSASDEEQMKTLGLAMNELQKAMDIIAASNDQAMRHFGD